MDKEQQGNSGSGVGSGSVVTPESVQGAEAARLAMEELRSQLDLNIASELFFEFAFKHVNDIVFLLRVEPNEGYRFVAVNPAFGRVTGVPDAAVIGNDVRSVIPERSHELVLSRYRQAIQERRTVRWEETSEYPTGTKHGEVSITPVFNTLGACVNLIGTVRDLTERSEARTLQNRLSSIMEATTDLVAFAEIATGNVLYLNDSGKRLLGLCEDLPKGLKLGELFSESERKRIVEDVMVHVIASGSWRGESLLQTRQGKTVPVHSVLIAHEDVDGVPKYVSTISRDMTAQVRTQQALLASRDRLERAQRISHSGFLDWNLRTNELDCSDEVYRWYGVEKEDAPTTAEFVAQVVHPDDLELTRTRLESAIRGESDYDLDHRIVQRDGAVRWVRAQAELMRDADGKPERLLGTMVDITERKLAEEEIKKLNADLEARVAERTSELEATNQELTAFSYSVSHDLRAPLRHINGYVDMLVREVQGELSPKAERYLGVIASVSREMGVLIDELLAFSRMSQAEMNRQVYGLSISVQSALRDVESLTEGRNIEWSIAELPRVNADPNMIKLVFTNLFENAIKFTRPRDVARIEVGTQGMRDDRHVIFVRDNGVGFESQYMQQMFGVFQRLHRADEFEGTGIGLANVQRIVTRHGGEVWAEGAVDQGATLYFTLSSGEPANTEET